MDAPRPMAVQTDDLDVRWQVKEAGVPEALIDIEKRAYAWPWSRGNFEDSLRAGYAMPLFWLGDQLAGYWVAMRGVGETHLLNITVAPEWQGRGLGGLMLAHLLQWSARLGAGAIWLEVRAGNVRAQALYRRFGFEPVGLRRRYYPADRSQREDAVVMRLTLAQESA